jgi:capsular polysaccharide biosynthesis protein
MPAASPQAQHFDFYKYLRIMWRRKWLLVIPLVVCIPLGIVGAIYYPTEYESRAILELASNAPIGQGHRRGNIGAALSSVHTKMLSWNSVRDVILSQKVDFGREVDPDDRRQIEYLYHEIGRRTRVDRLGTQHLAVTHRSTSPEKNASLVNELVKQFVGESRREAQDKARTDVKYYNDKLAVAKTGLNDITARVREFNQANPWLGESVADLHRQYEAAQEEELRIRKRISQVEEILEEQKQALENEDETLLVEVAVPPSQEYVAAEQALKRAENYFASVSSRYTAAHRRFQEAKGMLAGAQAEFEKVKAEGQGRKSEELRENPKYKLLVKRIAETQESLDNLNEQRLNQNKKVSELYVKVRRAPELLATRRAHMEEAAALKATVQEYAKGARAADRELQRLLTEAYSSEFRVIEYARDDRRPVKSTKAKIIALGAFLGLMIGVGLMALVEYLDQTFKTIDDARVALGIPALGVVPAIFTPRDHRRRLWFRVLAVSSAVFVVGVGVAIYLMVPATQDYLAMGWNEFKTMMERW